MAEIWFENFKTRLAMAKDRDLTPKEWAAVLHEGFGAGGSGEVCDGEVAIHFPV